MKLYATLNVDEINAFSDTIDSRYSCKLEKIEVKYPMISLYMIVEERITPWDGLEYRLKEKIINELCCALGEAYLMCDEED
jgi:hypothetical protein